MSVKAMQTELGVIGQRYENRKNKKTGILEERDENKRQLMFRSDDGKSFIVMYSTFRSDWRKVKEGETELKLAKPEPKPAEKKPAEKTAKVQKALTDKEHQELRMSTMDAVVEAVESAGLDCKVKITGKTKGISVKIGRANNMEVYVENKEKVSYVIYFRYEVQLPKTYGADYEYHENFNLKHKYRMDDLHLKEFIKMLKTETTKKEEE